MFNEIVDKLVNQHFDFGLEYSYIIRITSDKCPYSTTKKPLECFESCNGVCTHCCESFKRTRDNKGYCIKIIKEAVRKYLDTYNEES